MVILCHLRLKINVKMLNIDFNIVWNIRDPRNKQKINILNSTTT